MSSRLTWSRKFRNANRLCSLHSAPCENTIPPDPSLPPSSSDESDEKNAPMIVLRFLGLPVMRSSLNALDKNDLCRVSQWKILWTS